MGPRLWIFMPHFKCVGSMCPARAGNYSFLQKYRKISHIYTVKIWIYVKCKKHYYCASTSKYRCI